MMSVSEVSNLIQRRCGFNKDTPDIEEVVADFTNDSVKVIIKVSDYVPADRLTKIDLKYRRLFDDLADKYQICTMYLSKYSRPKPSIFIIWNKRSGYFI